MRYVTRIEPILEMASSTDRLVSFYDHYSQSLRCADAIALLRYTGECAPQSGISAEGRTLGQMEERHVDR